MEWKSAETQPSGLTKIPERWLHLYYYEALTILFRFENALRIFVYVVLKDQLGKGWSAASLGDNTTIQTETRKRINQARDHGYLGYEVSSPMLYLNSGELATIILSDAYWKHFAPYFKASKSIVQTKLQEIGTVRNSLAHFRPIKEDDIDLIKQNSRHVLLEIERCLVDITSISSIVPTNTASDWYRNLKSAGTDSLRTALYSSPDQRWIRLELLYQVPVLRTTPYASEFISYQLGSLRTSQLLEKYDALKEHCIYLSEAPVTGDVDSDGRLSATKDISIVFSKATIERELAQAAKAVQDIVAVVEKENDLIRQDNLVQGELVEAKYANASAKEDNNGTKYWITSLSALSTSPSEITAVEYWGQRYHFSTDFVSSEAHYPWMPSSVSRPDWFL